MLTDTHCHLDYNKFDEDRDAVLQRAIEAGLTRILIPALEHEIQPVCRSSWQNRIHASSRRSVSTQQILINSPRELV